MKLTGLIVILLNILLMVGCFEMSEEIWFNDDGTGRFLIDISVSEGLLAIASEGEGNNSIAEFEKIEEDLKNDPDVEDVLLKEFSEGGMRHFLYEIKVKDSKKIADIHQRSIKSSKAETDFEAMFKLEDLGGDRIRFQQIFSQDATDKKDSLSTTDEFARIGEELGAAMAAAMFADKYFVVTIHAPKIENANGEINEEKNTVVWHISLAEMMAQKGFERSLDAVICTSLSLGEKIKKLFRK